MLVQSKETSVFPKCLKQSNVFWDNGTTIEISAVLFSRYSVSQYDALYTIKLGAICKVQ